MGPVESALDRLSLGSRGSGGRGLLGSGVVAKERSTLRDLYNDGVPVTKILDGKP